MDSKLFAQVIGATPASVVGDVQQARDDEKQLSIMNSNNNSMLPPKAKQASDLHFYPINNQT